MSTIQKERLNRRYAKNKLLEGMKMWMAQPLQKRPHLYKLTVKITTPVYKSFFLNNESAPDFTTKIETVYAWGMKSFNKKASGIMTYGIENDFRIFYHDTDIIKVEKVLEPFELAKSRLIIFPTATGFSSKYA